MNGKKGILVGVDFSARSRTAAEMAVMLSTQGCAAVEFIHVIEADFNRWDAKILGLDTERTRDTLEQEASVAMHSLKNSLGCEQSDVCILFGNAAQQITKHYADREAELLVIGNSGAKSAEGSKTLGTTAYRLVEHGPDRLLVVKPSYHGKLDRIAAAIDYSPVSDKVLAEAARLAEMTSSELSVIHVYSVAFVGRIGIVGGLSQMDDTLQQLKAINDERIKRFVEERLPPNVSAHTVAIPGSERAMLSDYLMEQEIDVVVVGTGTSARLAGFPIGSVTHGILNDTMSSVFVIRSSHQMPA